VRDPEGELYGFKAYGAEWLEADDCLRVLGQCSLGLVEKAVHDYLREFTRREFGILGVYGPATTQVLDRRLKPYRKKDGWFGMYGRFLEAQTTFRWSAAPITRTQLEQINLTRNDIAHDPRIDNTLPMQSHDHFEKYPISAFADAVWLSAMMRVGKHGKPGFPIAIHVSRENLTTHIDYIRLFCVFVEAHRTK
jgi:hypothetical protein